MDVFLLGVTSFGVLESNSVLSMKRNNLYNDRYNLCRILNKIV